MREFPSRWSFLGLRTNPTHRILIEIAKQTKIAPFQPREASNLNRIHRYDGNIIGGLLLGSGMGLTGACPGTILVQVASGIHSGLPVLAGGIIGGILWSRFGHCAKCTPSTRPTTIEGSLDVNKKHTATVYESSKMSSTKAVFIYEILCLSIILTASYLLPEGHGSQRSIR